MQDSTYAGIPFGFHGAASLFSDCRLALYAFIASYRVVVTQVELRILNSILFRGVAAVTCYASGH